MVAEYTPELEADFQRFYGIDLADLWTGKMSPRRAWNLVENLPAGAALWQAIGGPNAWTGEEYALHSWLWKLTCVVLEGFGAKQRDMPEQPKPPEIGWREKLRAKAMLEKARIARIKARNKRQTNGLVSNIEQ